MFFGNRFMGEKILPVNLGKEDAHILLFPSSFFDAHAMAQAIANECNIPVLWDEGRERRVASPQKK